MTYKQAQSEKLWLAFEEYAEPQAIMLSEKEHQYTEEEWSDVLPWWECFRAGAKAKEAELAALRQRVAELEKVLEEAASWLRMCEYRNYPLEDAIAQALKETP